MGPLPRLAAQKAVHEIQGQRRASLCWLIMPIKSSQLWARLLSLSLSLSLWTLDRGLCPSVWPCGKGCELVSFGPHWMSFSSKHHSTVLPSS